MRRGAERTSGFRSSQGTTPGRALAGQNTGPLVADFLIRAEKVSDLASTGTNVTCQRKRVLGIEGGYSCRVLLTSWNVGIGTNVAGELMHEGLHGCQLGNAIASRAVTYITEPADFIVRAAFGVEIAATLGTAHRNTSQSILEDL